MAEQEQITITYETLFELLRREKNREELQSLPPTFYDDVAQYLKEKIEFIEKTRGDVFSAETTRAKENELLNIKKIVKDLYDKREKKILTLALDKSRTKSHLIDTSHLLKEELEFYTKVVDILNQNRDNLLATLLYGKSPMRSSLPNEVISKTETHESDAEESSLSPEIGNKPIRLIRFMSSIPKFVGPELEEYGPFEKDDMANLPTEIAQVLIDKGRAEEMQDN